MENYHVLCHEKITMFRSSGRFQIASRASDLSDLLVARGIHQQTPDGDGLHRMFHVGSAPEKPRATIPPLLGQPKMGNQ